MAANTAWLSVDLMGEELQGVTAIYLGVPPTAEPEREIVSGDVNGDGDVSIKDVSDLIALLLEDSAEEDTRSMNAKFIAADLNGDGRLTVKDVTLLIEMLLGSEITDGDEQ